MVATCNSHCVMLGVLHVSILEYVYTSRVKSRVTEYAREVYIYHKPHVHVYICEEMYPVFFFREGCVQITTVAIVENTEMFQTFYSNIKHCIYMDSTHLSVTCSNLQHT